MLHRRSNINFNVHYARKKEQLDKSLRQSIRKNKLFCLFVPGSDGACEWFRMARKDMRKKSALLFPCMLGLARNNIHLMINGEYLYSRFFSWPSCSIRKTESKDTAYINSVASTKCLPGQIRFPYPNADVTRGSSRKLPSGLRNRSGLKTSGSG